MRLPRAALQAHGPALVALAVAIIWGANFSVLKAALSRFDVLAFSFFRYLGMLVLAWTVVALRDRGRVAVEPRARPRLVAAGLLGYSGYILFSLLGLAFTSAFSNAILIATAPLFSTLYLSTRGLPSIGPAGKAGFALAVLGVGVFMAEKLAGGVQGAGVGDAISLAAAALYAAYTVVAGPLLARHSATVITAWTLTVGGLPVLAVAAPAGLALDWQRVGLEGWAVLAWSIVVPVYLAWTLWSWASARAGVAATNAFLFLVPVVGGLTSVVALGENLGPLKLSGAALILAGLILIRRRPPGEPAGAPERAPAPAHFASGPGRRGPGRSKAP